MLTVCSLAPPPQSLLQADTDAQFACNNVLSFACSGGSGSASPAATHQGDTLDGLCRQHAASTHHHHHKHQEDGSSSGKRGDSSSDSRLIIRPDSFSDSYLGLKVMVYWPADKKWWEATVCKVSTLAELAHTRKHHTWNLAHADRTAGFVEQVIEHAMHRVLCVPLVEGRL